MTSNCLKATVLFGCVLWAGTMPAHAAPEGYNRILQKRETVVIAGHKIAVPISVWMKTEFVTGAAYFDLWADADLSGFQAKVPTIAKGMSKHQTCGDRIKVKEASLEPVEDIAQLCMRVRHERWQCLKTAVPSINGFGLSLKKKTIAKTQVVSQVAHICAQMWPMVSEDGHTIELQGKITKNSVTSKSGFLGTMFNAQSTFRSKLRRHVSRAMSKFDLPVPDALQSFDSVVDDAKFRTREDGSLGMVLTIRVKVTASELPQILAVLSKN